MLSPIMGYGKEVCSTVQNMHGMALGLDEYFCC